MSAAISRRVSRLSSSSANCAYNGLGDHPRQAANSVTTNYSLDMATGLTQVQADGTNTYLYGLDRIGEQQPAGWQYHLGDALGSVRQLTDAAGTVTLSRRYEPYGELLHSTGSAVTSYGFTSEYTDSYTNLVYLRARWYDLTQVGSAPKTPGKVIFKTHYLSINGSTAMPIRLM